MTTKPAAPAQQRPRYYFDGMLPDPPRIYDVAQHRQQVHSESALEGHFRHLSDLIVDGEYYVQQDFQVGEVAPERVVPDMVIGFGVDHDVLNRRNGWVISEMGKPPDVVFEIASASTARRDYRTKPDVYAMLGVPEYWLFDETNGLYYPAPLMGYKLVAGHYRPIQIEVAEDGVHSGWSEVLRLYVCWVKGKLRFFDPVKGEYLRNTREALILLDDAETRIALSEAERQAAEAERETERRDRQAAEGRAAEAEAEVARLRELLRSSSE